MHESASRSALRRMHWMHGARARTSCHLSPSCISCIPSVQPPITPDGANIAGNPKKEEWEESKVWPEVSFPV